MMQPEKYIEKEEEIRKARNRREVIVFLISASTGFLAASFIHEAGHISTLVATGCRFESVWKLETIVPGAKISPKCFLNAPGLAIFYLSGHLVALVSAVSLGLVSGRGARFLTGGLSVGIFFSVSATVLRKGDFQNLAEVIGAGDLYGSSISLMLFLASSALGFYVMERTLDTSERKY